MKDALLISALSKLKILFSNVPILRLPNPRLVYYLRTDASRISIAAVLGQFYEGIFHPICYVSRKITPAESRYSISELEALSVIYAVRKLHRFLAGVHFIIQTDNSPITVIQSGVHRNDRIYRWSLILQNYTFSIEHIKGKDNILADTLSRPSGVEIPEIPHINVE